MRGGTRWFALRVLWLLLTCLPAQAADAVPPTPRATSSSVTSASGAAKCSRS
jgi:hypothetical protein